MTDSRRHVLSDASESTLYSGLSPDFTSSEKRFRDTNDTIPNPEDLNGLKHRPKAYEPPSGHISLIILTPLFFIAVGVALAIVTEISSRRGGFAVSASPIHIFGTVSAQFLASIIPVMIIVPAALLLRDQDWLVRMYHPYVRLNQGGASAEETLLLDYLYEGPFFGLFPSLHYKHRIVFLSGLVACLSYAFQPLASAICQIRQTPQTDRQDVISTEQIGLASNIDNLDGFSAAAGYVEAAAVHGLGDPPFVFNNWTTAEFIFPTDKKLNETLTINTTAVSTQPHCANPIEDVVPVSIPGTTNFSFSSISIGRCTPTINVTFNAAAANQQSGVVDVGCPDASQNIEKRPVMFWFLNTRKDVNPPKQEVKTVFCAPTIIPFTVTATAHLLDGRLDSCAKSGDFDHDNNVTGPPNNGEAFNALFFNISSEDTFVQEKAKSIAVRVPNAIFHLALLEPGGMQEVFDRPNRLMDLTAKVYTQHLSLSGKSIYFTKSQSTVPGERTSIVPRLWIDPLPSRILSICLVVAGLAGLIVHIINYRQRKRLLLTTPPGTIASITALTVRSGFGNLLLPYDNTKELDKKLKGIRFRLDKRTGAIVADEVKEGVPGIDLGRNEAFRVLLGQREEQFGQHGSSSQAAFQTAVGYPPWVTKTKRPSVY